MVNTDPGPCVICGTPYGACSTHEQGPVTIPQLPQRDAAARPSSDPPLGTPVAPAGDGANAGGAAPSLGDGTDEKPFSTSTYKGKKPRHAPPPNRRADR